MAWGRGRRLATIAVVAAVVLAVAVTVGYALTGRRAPAAAATATATVSRGTVSLTASAAGTVAVVSTRGLSFATTAVVTELDVKVGDTVSAGQVLAKVDPSAAQDAVTAAEQQVNAAQNSLTKAGQTPSPSTCTVAFLFDPSGSPSPSSSPSPSAAPSGRPFPSGRPSAGPSRSASRPCSTAGGTGSRGGSGGDPLASAQQQVNNAQLALLQAQQRLAGTVLTAPIAGKVISIAGTVGSQARTGGNGFIVLGDVADTEVQAQFSEADVASLAVGQPATITLPNRPQPVPGKVALISPVGTTSGRLVRYGVQIAFDAVPDGLLFGQSANVAVTTAQVSDALYVPSSAVTGIQNGTGTVTVRTDGRDEPRQVQLGLRGDQYTEIKSGLSEGEQVVL
jgi:multidrug efflux pump subunit AcrA (membrane-fusion protein)